MTESPDKTLNDVALDLASSFSVAEAKRDRFRRRITAVARHANQRHLRQLPETRYVEARLVALHKALLCLTPVKVQEANTIDDDPTDDLAGWQAGEYLSLTSLPPIEDAILEVEAAMAIAEQRLPKRGRKNATYAAPRFNAIVVDLWPIAENFGFKWACWLDESASESRLGGTFSEAVLALKPFLPLGSIPESEATFRHAFNRMKKDLTE